MSAPPTFIDSPVFSSTCLCATSSPCQIPINRFWRQLGQRLFERETIELPVLGPEDLIVEPLHGCWEGNMTHAVARDPIDVCAARAEDAIVLGNAGAVRVVDGAVIPK